jgi:hypothetical protein
MTPPHTADAVAALEIHGSRPEGKCYGRVSIMDSIFASPQLIHLRQRYIWIDSTGGVRSKSKVSSIASPPQ